MKRLITTALGLVLLATSIGACHKSGSNAGRDLQNPTQSAPANTVKDVAASQVGLMSAATVGGFTTPAFVTNAVIGDQYEIDAGQIALQRTKTPEVDALAKMMIADHRKLDQALKADITAANVMAPLPTALDQRRQGMLDDLKAAGDSDFDLAYLHQQLAAHLETLALMKGFENHGDNPALKASAAKAAPTIESHLAMVRDAGGEKLKALTQK